LDAILTSYGRTANENTGKGISLGFIVMWPYDQGGCTCSHCAPWGTNGFLKVAEPLALAETLELDREVCKDLSLPFTR
jgi:hypothetical protein